MDRAAGDDDVRGVDAVALCIVRAGGGHIAAGDRQGAAAGDGEIAADVDAAASLAAAGSGDSALPHQDQVDGRVVVIMVNGGVLMAALGDDGIVEGQGLPVPLDGVAVLVRVSRRDRAAFIRQGVGGGILVAVQPHAAHVNVGFGFGFGALSRLGNAVEVFVASSINLCFAGKRRTVDFLCAVCVIASGHRDLLPLRRVDDDRGTIADYRPIATLSGNFTAGDGNTIRHGGDAPADARLCVALSRNSAVVDGDLRRSLDAIAVFIGFTAHGGDPAAIDDDPVALDSIAPQIPTAHRAAAGGGQAALSGDGEGNILFAASGVDTIAVAVCNSRPGDGVGSCQDKAAVVAEINGGVLMAALGDGGAVEGQGAAVPHDVVVVPVSAVRRDRAAHRPGVDRGGFCCGGQFHAAHMDRLTNRRRQRRRGQQGQAQGQAGQDAEQSSFVQVGSSFRVPAAPRCFPGRRRFSLLHTPSWEPGNWW